MIKIFIVAEKYPKSTQNRETVASVLYSLLEERGAYPIIGWMGIKIGNSPYDGRTHLCVEARKTVYGSFAFPDETVMVMTPEEAYEWSYWNAPANYQRIGSVGLKDIEKYRQAYNMYAYEDYVEDD